MAGVVRGLGLGTDVLVAGRACGGTAGCEVSRTTGDGDRVGFVAGTVSATGGRVEVAGRARGEPLRPRPDGFDGFDGFSEVGAGDVEDGAATSGRGSPSASGCTVRGSCGTSEPTVPMTASVTSAPAPHHHPRPIRRGCSSGLGCG